VNNDGIDDIIVGAPFASSKAGKAYVIFGKSSWTSSISLSMLNGANGFELDGGAENDKSGISVARAGDVNDDGINDVIIGAFNASSGSGKTYVVFGDSPPVLINNSLRIVRGGIVYIDASSLSAYDLNHANESLIFVPTNVHAGRFEVMSNPGVLLTN